MKRLRYFWTIMFPKVLPNYTLTAVATSEKEAIAKGILARKHHTMFDGTRYEPVDREKKLLIKRLIASGNFKIEEQKPLNP